MWLTLYWWNRWFFLKLVLKNINIVSQVVVFTGHTIVLTVHLLLPNPHFITLQKSEKLLKLLNVWEVWITRKVTDFRQSGWFSPTQWTPPVIKSSVIDRPNHDPFLIKLRFQFRCKQSIASDVVGTLNYRGLSVTPEEIPYNCDRNFVAKSFTLTRFQSRRHNFINELIPWKIEAKRKKFRSKLFYYLIRKT